MILLDHSGGVGACLEGGTVCAKVWVEQREDGGG